MTLPARSAMSTESLPGRAAPAMGFSNLASSGSRRNSGFEVESGDRAGSLLAGLLSGLVVGLLSGLVVELLQAARVENRRAAPRSLLIRAVWPRKPLR